MKTSDLIMLGATAFAGVLAIGAIRGKAQAATPAAAAPSTWSALAGSSSAQTQLTDSAIAQNWNDTFSALDKSDPAWWI